MGKHKKERRESQSEEIAEDGGGDRSMDQSGVDKDALYGERVRFVTAIAKPLASRKLAKKVYKIVKKAQKHKLLRKGVREVQKFIRKGERGIVILAGDTHPIEVICHMPVVCEESEIPYCYTPSKEDLGAASGSRRPTCMVLIKPHETYEDLYSTIKDELDNMPQPI